MKVKVFTVSVVEKQKKKNGTKMCRVLASEIIV